MSFKLVSFFYIYICCFTAKGRGMWTDQQCLRWLCDDKLLADRTNGRAIGTVFRLSVCRLSVTLCIVAKRCVLE